tara:strand:+ start:142 stop:312 length:171 start_codon:yes stop_codon:yes gene_type:complete
LLVARKRGHIELVAINDLADAKTFAHLHKYGIINGKIELVVSKYGSQIIDLIRIKN